MSEDTTGAEGVPASAVPATGTEGVPASAAPEAAGVQDDSEVAAVRGAVGGGAVVHTDDGTAVAGGGAAGTAVTGTG